MIINADYSCDQCVIVLGMFDGVHIGHSVLLQKGRRLADRAGVPLVVLTFAEHPLSVIAKAPPLLTDFDDRAALMEKAGVDVLVARHFTPEVMNLSPEEYIGDLVRRFHPTDVVCGYNHTFGKQAKGTPAFLEALGHALGFRTWVVPKITNEGKEVSSTAVREALLQGDVSLAGKLLGRPYSLAVSAKEDGILVTPPQLCVPADGKYRCLLEHNDSSLPCVVSVRQGKISDSGNGDGRLVFLAKLPAIQSERGHSHEQ